MFAGLSYTGQDEKVDEVKEKKGPSSSGLKVEKP
jgi:hypothetical protein